MAALLNQLRLWKPICSGKDVPPRPTQPVKSQPPASTRSAAMPASWVEVKALLRRSFSEWNRQNATRLCASLAFYSLLSLAPLLLLTVSIAGLVLSHNRAESEIAGQLQALVGPAAAKAATAFLGQPGVKVHGILGTTFSILTMLFSASGVLIELRDSLNYIWEIPAPAINGLGMIKSFLRQRLFSFGMVLSIGFLLTVSLFISSWIASWEVSSASIPGSAKTAMHLASVLVSFCITAVLFGAMYKVLPETHSEWRDVLAGGAVTSLLFTIGKFVLGLYLGRASYASMYGAAASVVVLIAWVYYSAQIFYLGAEFTKVLERWRYDRQELLQPAA